MNLVTRYPPQETTVSLPGLRGLEHIGLAVPDLEQATDFFAEVLGWPVVYATGPVLNPEDIQIERPAVKEPWSTLPEPSPDFNLEEFLDQARAHLIHRAVEKAGGNLTAAAALLGISKQAVSKFLADKRR